MQIGQPDDPRRFRRPYPRDITKDIKDPPRRWPQCEVCKLRITGKQWQIAPGKYVCTRCHNE